MNATPNYTGEKDENGKNIINESYYNNAIRDKLNYYIQALNYNPDKLTGNHLNAIFRHIYKDIFAHNCNQGHNEKCNVPYSHINISILYSIYTTICNDFVCMPSLYGFSLLTGIDENKVKEVTAITSENINNRREFVRNKLIENNLGLTVLANNDTSIGLLYTRQNAIETQAIKQGLSLSDLKPITDKSV